MRGLRFAILGALLAVAVISPRASREQCAGPDLRSVESAVLSVDLDVGIPAHVSYAVFEVGLVDIVDPVDIVDGIPKQAVILPERASDRMAHLIPERHRALKRNSSRACG